LQVSLSEQDWRRGRFLAFCGIGNPAAFFGDLRNWGFQVVRQHSFPDHHLYTAREAAGLEEEAADCGADGLVCTEKDVWNLQNVQFTKTPAYCCRISSVLPEGFRGTLEEVLQNRKAGAAR
jgi:tetraacyldisaccharide 4'-kinase